MILENGEAYITNNGSLVRISNGLQGNTFTGIFIEMIPTAEWDDENGSYGYDGDGRFHSEDIYYALSIKGIAPEQETVFDPEELI